MPEKFNAAANFFSERANMLLDGEKGSLWEFIVPNQRIKGASDKTRLIKGITIIGPVLKLHLCIIFRCPKFFLYVFPLLTRLGCPGLGCPAVSRRKRSNGGCSARHRAFLGVRRTGFCCPPWAFERRNLQPWKSACWQQSLLWQCCP